MSEQVVSSKKLEELTDKEKEEVAIIIATGINEFIEMSDTLKFDEKEIIVNMVDAGNDNIEKGDD